MTVCCLPGPRTYSFLPFPFALAPFRVSTRVSRLLTIRCFSFLYISGAGKQLRCLGDTSAPLSVWPGKLAHPLSVCDSLNYRITLLYVPPLRRQYFTPCQTTQRPLGDLIAYQYGLTRYLRVPAYPGCARWTTSHLGTISPRTSTIRTLLPSINNQLMTQITSQATTHLSITATRRGRRKTGLKRGLPSIPLTWPRHPLSNKMQCLTVSQQKVAPRQSREDFGWTLVARTAANITCIRCVFLLHRSVRIGSWRPRLSRWPKVDGDVI